MGQGAAGQSFYTFEGRRSLLLTGLWETGPWFTMDVEEYMAPARQIRNSILIVAVILSLLIGMQLDLGYVQIPS